MSSVAAYLAWSCPFRKSSDPNAIDRKTTLSIGMLTAFVASTRTPSCTRPRNQAPNPLSRVSETANAARLAPTIRHVSAISWNVCPGKAAGAASTILM